MYLSLSQWFSPNQSLPKLHHGEKLSNKLFQTHHQRTYSTELPHLYNSQMLSFTADSEDFIDMETMQFVSPYEVNPIAHIRTPQITSTSQQVSVNPAYVIPYKNDITQNMLKMEEFSDLSALLSAETNVDIIGSTDELNTPVFDKEAFYFSTPNQTKTNEEKHDLKVKVEYNKAPYFSCGKNQFTNLSLAADKAVQSKGNYNNSISKVGKEQSDMYLYQPVTHSTSNEAFNPPDQGIDFLAQITALDNGVSFTSNLSLNNNNNNIKNSNSTTTSPQDDRYSYISSPADDQQMDLDVPEHYDHSYDIKPKLNLMLMDQFKFPIKQEGASTLNTPDVIEEVVKMGDDFNILDLVNNEDITIISADEDLLSSLTSPSAFSSEPSTPSTTLSKPSSPVKKNKRRKHSAEDDDDDDDEDYVPPIKKSTARLSDIDIENNSNSSDDDSYHPKQAIRRKPATSKPRGRPPKRADSMSSDGSKDQDVSKYRELRDKNNEASRKSRQKRKLKEVEYEKEADELHFKNIRLKAQVEELEKMVGTFRDNLFKIIVPK